MKFCKLFGLLERIHQSIFENIQVYKEYREKDVRQYNDYNLGNGVELYYWGKNNAEQNLGDYLSAVVCEYLLSQNNITPSSNNKNGHFHMICGRG